ncbi:MAG: HicB family protein [Candidatus Diapherotrites archaeon CG08_land_8_20_14_0_20_30_16]|nr:MAG: HicB family protein [Candidatus Diapherotrites archaeon CG08_land_8_20_14_0_20_30_16]
MKLTAIIKKGEKQYVALCPEVDVVSQGYTIETALANLKEAVELHIEVMHIEESKTENPFITSFEVIPNGKTTTAVG